MSSTATSSTHLTDENLFQLCQKYGQQARWWRQKFAGLLPEVNRRRLYQKKNFRTIFDFARILAGLSEPQVRLVLSLAISFEDKPILKSLLEKGEASMNKLVRVASVATPKNEEFWATQVKTLSQSALEALVRDEKIARQKNSTENDPMTENIFQMSSKKDDTARTLFQRSVNIPTNKTDECASNFENQNPFLKPNFEDKSLRAQRFRIDHESEKMQPAEGNGTEKENTEKKLAQPLRLIYLKISETNLEKLLELQQKGINIDSLIEATLQNREQEIAIKKEKIAAELRGTEPEKNCKPDQAKKPSRYIPIKIKQIVQQEHGTKCSIATCNKPAENLHHTQRYSLAQNHDPHYLAPVCKDHHQIAHNIDRKYQQMRQAKINTPSAAP